jgi:hypothetical protein
MEFTFYNGRGLEVHKIPWIGIRVRILWLPEELERVQVLEEMKI